MTRAYLVKKSARGNARTCAVCGEPIEPGQQYYYWKSNFGPSYGQHAEHGQPKPSQMTNSKMGEVRDAVSLFDVTDAETIEDIQAALEGVASVARSVAEQYSEAADNQLESFPAGNPTSEACQATSDLLEEWADDLESWTGDAFDDTDIDDEDEREDAREQWLTDMREEAQAIVEAAPEYQG